MMTTPPGEPRFVGYIPASDRQPDLETFIRCDTDRRRTVSNGYGTCCRLDGGCWIPTTCLAATMFSGSRRRTCASDSSCATVTIFPSLASTLDISDITLDFMCAPTSTVFKYSTLYLLDPVPQTSGIATVPSATGAADNSDDSGDSSSSSNAWIAGAVIAAVVALALAIAGFIFLWKGKKSAGQNQQQHPPAGNVPGKPELEGSQGSAVTGALGAPWQKAELGDGRPHVLELDCLNKPEADAAGLQGSEVRQHAELDPDGVPTTTFELEACIRGPHELAPDSFARPPGSWFQGSE